VTRYGLDPNDSRPPYRQIASQLRAAIRMGTYPPGSKLPTRVQLCRDFGVASGTVASAITVLHNENLVTSRRGKGVTVLAAATTETFTRESAATVVAAALEGIVDAITAGKDRHALPHGLANALRELAGAKPQWRANELDGLADMIIDKCKEVSAEDGTKNDTEDDTNGDT
jgi:DNA-binding transcriptional regulator YhcF (GntR family)